MKDKIEILLPRIAALEKLFEQPAGDEKETRRREGLLMYAIGLHSEWMLIPALVNSRVSKRNCGRWMGSPWPCDISTMLKMVMMSVVFLKTYRRQSMTTWSVHNCGGLSNIDHNNRWCNKWQSMNKDASSWYVSPFFAYKQIK